MKSVERLDQVFILLLSCLLALGLVMVYSSSMTSAPGAPEQAFLVRQAAFLLVAMGCASLAWRLPASWWRRSAPVLFGLTCVLLVLVLLPGIGRSVNGAQRWLRVGGWTLQPSELAKLTLPMAVAGWVRQIPQRRRGLPEFFALFGVTSIPILLVFIEPDLGTALFLGVSVLLALTFSGWPARQFLLLPTLVAPLAAGMIALKPYQLARLRGFLALWLSPDDAPYQLRQSLVTVGSGGLSGVGLGQGWQKLSFLPEANTDFVFAVIGEELGLCGTLGVVLLWAGIYLAGLRMVRRLPSDSWEAIVASTLLVQLTLQAAINMAVVTALLPPKGISHPFISYGGSSLLVSLLSASLILSLTQPRKVAMARRQDVDPQRDMSDALFQADAA